MTLIEHIRAGKPVMTKGEFGVVVHTTEARRLGYPIMGEIFHDVMWRVGFWTADGTSSGYSHWDLIPAPEPERTLYVNVYSDNYLTGPYDSADRARGIAVARTPIAIAVPLTFRPGQGIEGRTA